MMSHPNACPNKGMQKSVHVPPTLTKPNWMHLIFCNLKKQMQFWQVFYTRLNSQTFSADSFLNLWQFSRYLDLDLLHSSVLC